MSYNIIGPLPNKSVAPNEKVEKSSADLDEIEEPVVRIRQNYLDDEKKGEYQEISLLREICRSKGLV